MPLATDYLPRREADLLQWSNNFNDRIGANFALYGLSNAQATAYATLHDNFQVAWETANENVTRTPSAIQTKNTAKQALIRGDNGIRELAMIVQKFPGTTNAMRSDLGLTVPDAEPSPIPPPQEAPGITILSSVGRTVKVRFFDSLNPKSKAKPAGVLGASLYTFVGPTPPNDIDDWKYEGSTTKTTIVVEFPPSTANGATVWFSAYWTNGKLESGPPSQPVSINIPGGLSMAA